MSRKTRRVDTTKRGKFTEVLEQFAAAIAEGYVAEFQDTPDAAKTRANFAIGVIQTHAKGTAIYIGQGHLWHVSELHRRIYRRFNGTNHAQLAHEFDLSERQIYNIIAAVEAEEFKRRQPDLFEQTLDTPSDPVR